MDPVKIIECPRDAWQGLPKFIPTEVKSLYLNRLLRAGFRRIDAVSFVSPKYVPQMADSEQVMQRLHLDEPGGSGSGISRETEIIGIAVNEPGFNRALAATGVTTIGYPYSISERFSRQNQNISCEESRRLVERMAGLIRVSQDDPGRTPALVVYVSMAFGNPYGEPWHPDNVVETIEWLKRTGVRHVSLADTVGKASAEDVAALFNRAKEAADGIEIGVHLHSRREGAKEKVMAAYEAGCRRFDSALTGLGGCPFAGDDLVGNIPTEIVIDTLRELGEPLEIDFAMLGRLLEASNEIRNHYGH